MDASLISGWGMKILLAMQCDQKNFFNYFFSFFFSFFFIFYIVVDFVIH